MRLCWGNMGIVNLYVTFSHACAEPRQSWLAVVEGASFTFGAHSYEPHQKWEVEVVLRCTDPFQLVATTFSLSSGAKSSFPMTNLTLQVHWSGVTIGTSPLSLLHPPTPSWKSSISKDISSAAYSIIAAKGCTNFGIGNIAASICKYILSDQRTVRPVSYYQEDLGVTLSMPAVIGRKGIVRPIKVQLDEEEEGLLRKCAEGLREVQEKAQGEVEKVQKEAEEKEKGEK